MKLKINFLIEDIYILLVENIVDIPFSFSAFPFITCKQAMGLMDQKGTTLDHDFYVVVGKQCRTESAYAGHQHNIFI